MSPFGKAGRPASVGNIQTPATAAETSVRQLIANGKCKAALDQAKDYHKRNPTAASEALLVEAYSSRIQSLLQQSLLREAQALIDLVCERYPLARIPLEAMRATVAARSNALDDLVRPLRDPLLGAEHREAIERAICEDVSDLAALAARPALPAEHPLRQAASALDQAFRKVTGGPVAEDVTGLPEVSRRSPLAPWKLLVRAIASYYRGDDEACREQLDAIAAGSAPARLAPAIRAMLGGTAPLSAAAAALVRQVNGNPAALRHALESLDRALAEGSDRAILAAARTAVQECRGTAPGQLDRLKQHVSVLCAVAGIGEDNVIRALGGPSRRDAYFLRLFARAHEQTGEPEDLALACAAWDEFRQAATKEGWFRPNGVETAAVYLHIAGVARKIPAELAPVFGPGNDFFRPEEMYQRACALDPHTEAFSEWMDWAREKSAAQTQRVAEAWHKACPADLDPVLVLMQEAARKKAFPTALKYLARAERLDGVHPQVRRARLRLMTGSIIRHIQQNKPHLAEEKLAALTALPQAQQGDRSAFLSALRFLVSELRGDIQAMGSAYAETERLLAGGITAKLLIFGLATAAKQHSPKILESPGELSRAERAAIPACLARVVALAKDMNTADLRIPWSYIDAAAKQLRESSASLDTGQLQVLAEAGVSADHSDLAYTASAVGLERGGSSEPRFLLLRARSLPEEQIERRALCTAAVVQMARQCRDTELLEEAANLLHGPLHSAGLTLTPEEAEEVLAKEQEERRFLGRSGHGPDYRAILARRLCDCPDCRRARGELVEPFEDFDEDEDDAADLNDIFASMPDIPKEVGQMLFEETRQAVENGESLDSLMSRLFGSTAPRPKKKKGRRG